MASAKKKPPSDEESLTPPINLDGTRPVPSSGDQAVIDADNQAIIDDALAGNIKLERYNTAPGVNPANPYAGENRDPNWKPPTEKPVVEAVGDAIVNAVPALRTWGAPEEEKPKEEPKGGVVYVDPSEGRGASRAAPPRVIPAHDSDLVNPVRGRREQDAYEGIKSGYIDQRAALEGQKDAEDKVAQARNAQNAAKAEGARKVADVADQARWNVESRALDDKTAQDSFRAKMEKFSQDLADDKIEVRTTVPQQITWAIARVFGAIQQGLQHLPSNQVADQIDAHIKQSLELQKTNRAGKKERLGDMQKFYDMASAQSKDQGERSRIAYGYALEAAKAEADALAAASGDPLNLAEAEKIKAALTEKQAQIETTGEYGTELLAAQADIRNHKWVQAGIEGGGAEKPSKHVYYDPIDKTYYAAESEPDKKKLTESVQVAMQIRDAAERYQATLKNLRGVSGGLQKVAGKAELDSSAMSEARAAHIALLTDIRDANQEGGVIREGLKKAGIYEHSIISPDKLTGDADKQIDVIVDRTKNLHRVTRDILAPVPVDRVAQPYGQAPKNLHTGEAPRPAPKQKPAAAGFVPAGAKAKGGDVGGNQPYLVGEEGPELVVPNKPGFVLTALQTAALRGAPPTKQQAATLPPRAKSAVERYAAKMGVAREDGGSWNPLQDLTEAAFEPMRRDEPAKSREPHTANVQTAKKDTRTVEGSDGGLRYRSDQSVRAIDRSHDFEDSAERRRQYEQRIREEGKASLTKKQPQHPPEWLDRYMTSEGLALPAREDGGAMTPEDEEEARRFLGPDIGQARSEKPKTPEEAAWEQQKADYEKKEGERIDRVARERARDEARKAAEADAQRMYEQDKYWHEGEPIQKRVFGPVAAWANKVAGKYDVLDTEQLARRKAEREAASKDSVLLRYARWANADRRAPEWAESAEQKYKPLLDRARPGGTPPVRQPVSFERDPAPAGPPPPPARADGGEVLPPYEPEGKELHQSLDGHAYLASKEERPSGASLSGSLRRLVAPAADKELGKMFQQNYAPRAERPAPPPRKPTPEELMRMADELDRDMRAKHEARMAEGPSIRRAASGSPETNYETELTSGAERAFKNKFRIPDEEPWERKLGVRREGEDYDLRGAFAGGDTDGQRVEFSRDGTPYFPGHLPDTYKKPNHETFSTESQYAKDAPTLAGQWAGDKYVRNPQRPPEWLEQYMSGDDEDRVGSDYEDDEDALARRACGGAMQPKGLAATFAQGMSKTQRRR